MNTAQPLPQVPPAHHDALLASMRCGLCAEPAQALSVMREQPCGACGEPLRWKGGGTLLEGLEERRLRSRLVGYALVGGASLLVGWLPFAQAAIHVVGLVILHYWVLSRALGWLSGARRLWARFTVRLLASLTIGAALLVNVLLVPAQAWVGLGSAVAVVAHGATGLVLPIVYVEGGLWIVRQRLRWASEGRPIRVREWLPGLLFVALLLATLTAIALVVSVLVDFIVHGAWPGIHDLTVLFTAS